MTGATPDLAQAHHIASITAKPRETLEFYRDALGLPLVHTVSATGWISDGFPDFIHFFFRLGRGGHLAIFYFFGTAPPEAAAADELARRARHLAFDVGTEQELAAWRERLKAHGVRVTRPLAHELVESVYFDDPNGLQLEICRPLREFGPIDARDAEVTVTALIDAVEAGEDSLAAVWRRKAELISARISR